MGRELIKIVELDASPEQVWEAIATGPGISAWFVPHQVEERAGRRDERAVRRRLRRDRARSAPGSRAGASSSARPRPPPEGTADYAFEFLVEGRDGGGTVLRFVQSGFLDEGWEDEYSSLDTGLGPVLRQPAQLPRALRRAAGAQRGDHGIRRRARRPTPGRCCCRALGLTGRPAVGDDRDAAPRRAAADHRGGRRGHATSSSGVRSASGLHRIGAEGEAGCGVSAFHYFYGDPVDTDALTTAWQTWLIRPLPRPAEPARAPPR